MLAVVSSVIVLQFASTSLSQKAEVIRFIPDRLSPDSKLYEWFERAPGGTLGAFFESRIDDLIGAATGQR
jgi:hypothetical protein